MLAIDLSISSLVASDFLFPDVMIVSRILDIIVVIYSSSLSMSTVVIIRFLLENMIKKSLPSSLQVEKITYKVMTFVPKNTPAFYTAMLQICRDDWLVLSEETKHTLSVIIYHVTVICNDKIVIDDILLYSNHNPTLSSIFFLHCYSIYKVQDVF